MFTEPGRFVVGCNYWASHAGTAMWSDWRPEIVAADLRKLADARLQVLRVFPLWPDFQPLTLLRGGGGTPVEFRFGEQPLPDDDAGQAGVSAAAIARFQEFADLAESSGLKLVVGLITGWMSGRLFVPPAFDGRNVIADPVVVMWQVRFVKYFVQRFMGHPAIVAWDLGNECNCMGGSAVEGCLWTASIANAIRAVDPNRPIVSGMHSLSATDKRGWKIQDQAELTDVLTVHPYPVFTPHCDQDPVNTMRNCLHATAEARLYADVGSKPCLAEEVGTLGPMIASERVAADYIRANLFSLWAHDCRGLLWWCAHEQAALTHAPYDWCTVERELGLFHQDGTPKPVLAELTAFRNLLEKLPFDSLPARTSEAVCILSDSQDHWGVAYAAFVLARQAGVDLEFQYETQPLKNSSVYLLPCVSGHRIIVRRRWQELLARVRAGATLYISHNDGLLSDFEEVTGLRVETRQRRTQAGDGVLEGLPGKPAFRAGGPFRLTLTATRAEVLGREADGNPAYTCAEYGRGRVCFLSFPLELELTRTPGAFHSPQALGYWPIYRHVAQDALAKRAVSKSLPHVGVTEHPLDAGRRVVVAINYSPVNVETSLAFGPGWTMSARLHGAVKPASGAVGLSLPANDAAVFEIARS